MQMELRKYQGTPVPQKPVYRLRGGSRKDVQCFAEHVREGTKEMRQGAGWTTIGSTTGGHMLCMVLQDKIMVLGEILHDRDYLENPSLRLDCTAW